MNYLETNGRLSVNQYGFRNGRSTEDAVLHLTSNIVKYVEAGDKCIGVFLDLQKAFDTVSIPILLTRLENAGVRGIPLQWFVSYLTGREQCVRVENQLSNVATCTYGVPQGSTLGPTLFLVYINVLCQKNIMGADLFMFADDTVLLFRERSWNAVFKLAECGLKEVTAWLEDNLLTVNSSKTKYLCFRKTDATKPNPECTLTLHHYPCNRTNQSSASCCCPQLEQVTTIKYLGVVVDDRLTWGPHISALAGRTRKLIYIFKSLRGVLHKDLIMKIYKALGESILAYCITAWGGAAKTYIIEAERAQRALLKVINRFPFRFPTTDLYKECNVLSVRRLYIYQSIRRYHRSTVPKLTIKNKRVQHVPLPSYRSTYARRHYEYQAAYLYNKINPITKIINCNNHNIKTMLKKWLCSLEYDSVEMLFYHLE